MALSPIPVMKKGFYEYYPDWVMKALEDQTGVALEKVPSDLRRELQKLIKWGSVEKALEPYQPPVAPVPRPPRPDLLPPEEAYPAIDWEQGRAVGSRSLGAAPPQYSPTTATLQSTGAITKGPAVPITAWSDPGPCPEGCSPYEWTLFGKCYPITSYVPGLQDDTTPATPPAITAYTAPETATQSPSSSILLDTYAAQRARQQATLTAALNGTNGASTTAPASSQGVPKWFLIAAGVGLLLLFLKR